MRVGDAITVGTTSGRIRAMYNYKGENIEEAGPSTPVEIAGLNEVPNAGDKIYVTEDDQRARYLADYNAQKQRKERLSRNKNVSLDDLFDRIKEGNIKDLNVIIKGDVHGSIEALKQSLTKLSNDEIKINIIHANVGTITDADVSLAAASNAVIIGFNVRPSASVAKVAKAEDVDIRTYRIIYNAINDLKDAMNGMLEPEYKEVVQGEVEVRDTFKVSSLGTIAGCYVTNGIVTRNSEARLLRNGVIIYEGEIDSLKRFENDAKEVAQGYECGIMLKDFNDIKVGDVIEPFTIKEVPRTK
jgi:translation initiation factor IF-2